MSATAFESGMSSKTFEPAAMGAEQAEADNKPNRSAKAKSKPPEALAVEGIPGAQVGLPIQFCNHDGEVVPAVLQRLSRTDKRMWDVRYFPGGASVVSPCRAAPYSETPKIGHWNFIPKS